MSTHNGRIKTTWMDHWKYGFIVDENDMDIRFHIDNSPDLSGKISSLTEGSPVEFEKKPSAKYPGKYEAHNVRLQAGHHMEDNTQSLSPSSPSENNTSQENILPKTCLILTVGTNALPVWIAWHHLKNLSEKLPHPIRVQLVHTEKTKDEMERLRTEMVKYYSKHSSEGFVTQVQTSPGDPCQVFDDITGVLNALPGETEHIHVHYTGGTQVMGVETVSAATKFDGLKHVSTSYLTVHVDSGPAIMGRRLTDKGNLSMDLINDTRVRIVKGGVDLEFLRFLASLNGFEIGKFTHEFRSKKFERPDPVQFKGEYLTVGKRLLECIKNSQSNGIPRLGGKWLETRRNLEKGGEFQPDSGMWNDIVFPFFKEVYPSLNWCETTSTLSYPARKGASSAQVEAFEGIRKFFMSTWLEYATAAAFHNALCEIDGDRRERDDNSRSNYAIFHNVHVRRITTESSVKDFELDVVAMLGHQIVVVSCTTDGDMDKIKQKGMEVLHRARQLGGDEARAVVLCRAKSDEANLVDNELKDETGGASEPLQIWGLDKWSELTQEFKAYCKELSW